MKRAAFVVAKDLGRVSLDEVMRVLSPDGVAFIKKAGRWTKTVKPRPKDMDDRTHFLHGADGNAVANDTMVSEPHHLQWTAAPHNARTHEAYLLLMSLSQTAGESVTSPTTLRPPCLSSFRRNG